MGKKKTIEEVINLVNIKSNGKVKVLSTEYINSNTPIKLLCECGNTFLKIILI